tara:strand:- start:27171 stop:27395 length:225 start_codon:yes stop_codon:yes gene_type:complete
MSCIIKATPKEFNKKYCEMCSAVIAMKKSFLYRPLAQKISGSPDMTICEPCAKREHGPKNKYKWKDLIKDLNDK